MKNALLVLTVIVTFFAIISCKAKCSDNIDLRWEEISATWSEACKETDQKNSYKYRRGHHDFSIKHDGLERTYSVYAPYSYNRKIPLPAVLVLHGGYGSAKYAEKQTWMSKAADKHAFIAVYPEALIGPENPDSNLKYQHWNGGPRVDPNKSPVVDDVGFISAMLDKLEMDFNIDPKRIYVTGISNGGTMAYRLACQLSDRIAAIAPVAANQLSIECNPIRPVSIIHFHGEEDLFIPLKGGIGPKLPDYWNPVNTTLSEWAERNACQRIGESVISMQAACTTHMACEDDSVVTLCVVRNHGHTWPGKGVYMGSTACQFNPNGFICRRLKKEIGRRNYAFPVDDIVWEFFKKHPMQHL